MTGWRVVGLAALLWLTLTTAQAAPEPLFAEVFADAPALVLQVAGADGVTVVRRRLVRLSRMLGAGPSTVTLNLFSDVAPDVSLLPMPSMSSDGAAAWTSAEKGSPAVVLSLVEGRWSGSARMPDGRFFSLRAVGAGVSEVREILYDRAFLGDDTMEAPGPYAEAADPAPRKSPPSVEQSATVDVLVAATPAAVAAAGGLAGIRDKANLAVAEANAGFASSAVGMQLRLVGVEQVDLGPGESASGGFLNTATGHSGLKALRNQYGADAVSVWLHGPGAGGGFIGLAWILQGQGAGFASNAYSVVEQNFAAGPGYGFAHELGHNLGCAHDRNNAGSPGAFPFSYGHQDQQGGFYTMMAYGNGCPGCSLVNAWSNPLRSLNGRPTGVPQGQPNAADNAATLNANRSIAAAWRSGGSPQPPAPTPSPTPTPDPTPQPPAPTLPGAPPRIISLSGSGEAGATASFTAVFEDPDDGSDIRFAEIQVSATLSTGGTCWLRYDQRDNAFQLVNDLGTGLKGQVSPGAGVVENSQCAILGAGSSATASDRRLTVTAAVRFQTEFAGSKKVFLKVTDQANLYAPWAQAGEWEVTASDDSSSPPPTSNEPPQAGSVTPSVGVGATARWTAYFADPDGESDISQVHLRLAPALESPQACWVRYDAAADELELVNDAADGFAPTLENSRCRIMDWKAVWIGEVLALSLEAELGDGLSGELEVWTYAVDAAGVDSGWRRRAAWIAPGRWPGP